MWRSLLLLVLLLLVGCAPGPDEREMNLYPTPGLPGGEAVNSYYAALAYYNRHELQEARELSKMALDGFERDKAPARQLRLGRELFARTLVETGDKAGALVEFRKLAQEYPKVPSYQKALQDLK